MKRLTNVVLAGLLGIIILPMVAAHASTLTITYYTISSSDPDANHLAGGVYTNEVQNGLGPHGLPILNIPQFGCSINCYAVNGAPGFPGGVGPNVNLDANGEITYWDPALNPYVSQTSQTSVTLPFNEPSNFFPPNGTGSANGGSQGFQAAVLSGTIFAPTTEQLSFNIGSDDMAFAYIDGQVVCDDGGVHGVSSVTCSTPTVSVGSHSFDLFFVDVNVVQSGLTFSINTQGVVTQGSVPEPASLTLIAAALLGFGVIRRRKSE